MTQDIAVLTNDFTDFLKQIGTGKTSLKALTSRLSDIFRWLTSHSLTLEAIQKEDTILRYEEERGIHVKRHVNSQLGRIKRFLLYRNLIHPDNGNGSGDKKGSIRDVAGRFLIHLENAGYRQKTIENYYYALMDFIRYADGMEITELAALSRKVMQDYASLIVSQAAKKRSLASRAIIISSVKQFTRYAAEEGYLLKDPMVHIRLPKQGKIISRNFLTSEEITAFFKVIDTTTLTGFTDRVIFEVMYGAGLRIGEVRSLERKDIDYDEGLLHVIDSKGGKNRNIPLPEITLKYLKVYINQVRPQLLNRLDIKTELVFFNYRGNRINKNWLNFWLRFYAGKAGITKKLTSHALRYCYATHMLEAGIDMRQLAELMGHESLDTTAGYTKVLVSDLKAEMEEHHPRGSLDTASLEAVAFKGVG